MTLVRHTCYPSSGGSVLDTLGLVSGVWERGLAYQQPQESLCDLLAENFGVFGLFRTFGDGMGYGKGVSLVASLYSFRGLYTRLIHFWLFLLCHGQIIIELFK